MNNNQKKLNILFVITILVILVIGAVLIISSVKIKHKNESKQSSSESLIEYVNTSSEENKNNNAFNQVFYIEPASSNSAASSISDAVPNSTSDITSDSAFDSTSDSTPTTPISKNSSDEPAPVQKSDIPRLIFIGDETITGIYQISSDYKTGTENLFRTDEGATLSWLIKQPNTVNNVIAPEDDAYIIIGLGRHDPENIEKYINFLNEKPFKTDKVYMLSLLPVNDEKLKANKTLADIYSEEKITNANNRLKDLITDTDIKIIDTNSYFITNGFQTTDGLNISKETCRNLYKFIIESLNPTKNEDNKNENKDGNKNSSGSQS